MSKNKKHINLIRLVVCLLIVAVIGVFPVSVRQALAAPVSNASIINVTSYVNIRNRASNKGVANTTATLGTRVTFVEEVAADSDDTSGYDKWSKIQIVKNGVTYTGYVASHFVQRDSLTDNPSVPVDSDFEESIAGFPESYKPYLRAMHNEHPTWVFHPENVGASWDTCLAMETADGVSLIQNTVDSAWISKVYDGVRDSPNWVNASSGIVAYYMDPRNMLNEAAVFQFVDLNYTDNSISEDAITKILSGTFMAKPNKATYVPGEILNYFQLFAIAGNEASADNKGINPIFLAAHCIQEVGINGSSSTRGSTGYYNFYNIGAYSSVTNAAANGLSLAHYGLDAAFNERYHIPWNTPGLAIVYGGKWIYDNYTAKGQDTLYYMRFNVSPDRHYGVCRHQYMTAIQSLAAEGQRMFNAYKTAGIMDTEIHFYVPVYDNMPEKACPIPTSANQYTDFINLVYGEILGRDPNSTEVTNWTNALNGGAAGSAMVANFISSTELASKNYSDTQYVQLLYRTLMGRDANSSDISYWTGVLASGKSRLGVYASIVNTTESQNYWRRFNVVIRGFTYSDTIDEHLAELRPVVVDIYQGLIGRVPTGNEIRNGISALLNSDQSITAIVAGLVKNSEFVSRSASYSNLVNYISQTLLGRELTPEENETYVSQIASGYSYEYVLAAIINSDECHAYMSSVGINSVPEFVSSDVVDYHMDIMDFVVELYSGVYGRRPDRDGARFWVRRLATGAISGPQASAQFFLSDEFTNAGLSNDEFLTRLYQLCYRRSPDASGYNYWITRLNTYYSREAVIAGFVNATEYMNVCSSYDLTLGYYVPRNKLDFKPNEEMVRSFVTRLYEMAYDREPDQAGLDYWSGTIMNGSYNGYTLSRYFVFSNEMESLELSDEEFLTRLYRIFMDREPDSAGFNYWYEKMQNGLDRRGVFDGFAYSTEYVRLCLDAGIRPYTEFSI